MSLAEMKAQIRELSAHERAELERYLAALHLEEDHQWQERAFQELRSAQRNPGASQSLENLRELDQKLSQEGR
jgi:hypothetical protein